MAPCAVPETRKRWQSRDASRTEQLRRHARASRLETWKCCATWWCVAGDNTGRVHSNRPMRRRKHGHTCQAAWWTHQPAKERPVGRRSLLDNDGQRKNARDQHALLNAQDEGREEGGAKHQEIWPRHLYTQHDAACVWHHVSHPHAYRPDTHSRLVRWHRRHTHAPATAASECGNQAAR